MNAWSHKRKPKILGRGNERYKWLVVVVFVSSFGLIARLFYLQVIKGEDYLEEAKKQQEIIDPIAPKRGRIFFQDPKSDTGDGLFPVADNKDYLEIFAVPKEIADEAQADKLANALYDFFKKAYVEKEVDQALKAQEKDRLEKLLAQTNNLSEADRALKIDSIRTEHDSFLKDSLYLEAKKKRREEMIEESKKAIIEKYKKSFANKEDQYELLEKKIDYRQAAQFHLSLLDKNNLPANFVAEDLDYYNASFVSNKVSSSINYNPLRFSGIGYKSHTFRNYPEKNNGSHLLGFVSFEPEDKDGFFGRHGRYGLEGYFDDMLFGKFGEMKAEKGQRGTIIANNLEVTKQIDGDDLILTIDRTIQFFVSEKIKEATIKYGADSGTAIILDPKTGQVVAMSSYPDFDPNNYDEVNDMGVFNNPAIFDAYEPGSVFKSITMAAALNEGKVTPETTYNDAGFIMINGWPKPIKNSDFETHGGHGLTTMTGVLENSLNTGAVFAMKKIGDKKFTEYLKKFGFGEKTGIELEGESKGNISNLTGKKIREINAATASFGQGINVTPIQMAASYAVIANGGKSVKPYIVKEIRHLDGSSETIKPANTNQIISEYSANLLSGMLVKVVEDGHSKKAQVPGYYIGCKTGTAQYTLEGKKGYVEHSYNHTFICLGPVGDPKFVVLVRFKNPKGYTYADATTVPVTQNIMQFLVDYWQLPKVRK